MIKHLEITLKIDVVYRPKHSSIVLNNIGWVYNLLGEKQKALEYYEKALSQCRTKGEQLEEAKVLLNIGAVYSDLAEKHKALDYFRKSLAIKRTLGDRLGEAINLCNIGKVHDALGEKQKALDYYEKSLAINLALKGDLNLASTTLNNIAAIYNDLGDNQKTLYYFKIALAISMATGDRLGIASTMNNFGHVFNEIDQKQLALKYHEKALLINRAVGNLPGEDSTLNNIGQVYNSLGKKKQAIEKYEKALLITRAVGDPSGEARVLGNIGNVYSDLYERQKAIKYYEKAIFTSHAANDKAAEAIISNNLMFSWKYLKKIPLSIFYGKLSVDNYQRLRRNISGLEKKMQISYLKKHTQAYRVLIDLLITNGRLSEARQVLNMLKEVEYLDFIRRDRSYPDTFSTLVDFTEFEKRWLQNYDIVINRLSNISSEHHLLKFKMKKNDAEKNRMKELESELPKARNTYQDFLIQLKVAFDKYEKDKKAMKEDVEAMEKRATSLQDTIKFLDETEGGKNVALHYLVYEGRISAIITIPNSPLVLKQWKVDEEELNKTVMNYVTFIMKSGERVKGVQLIETPTDSEKKRHSEILHEMLQYEKKLYDFTFKPVNEELKKYGVTNLTISLEGVLRYIPLGALWDGENYLVQRYRMALITPTSLKNIKDSPVEEKKILGFGASRGSEGFTPLPNVGREIRSIVKDEEKGYYGLIQGKGFINDDFNRDAMIGQLKTGSYPLVHISSHFKFSPGDETKNKLLLGDGSTIRLSEIRREGKLFDGVKLLVLSACETGVGGNGEEIDGFGELAQQSGVKSVVASLWPVADESTKDLMVAFYRNLKERKVTSKIEALRQAQLELAGLEDLLEKDMRNIRKKTKYSHPYYWGPFIIIGNWR